ncbi:MlaD family protein [Candidatus Entotheonella palauensis]|uniref:MlaD family protein n=1 Tax=Candidatus Entotheonella palauensis TaxID=93172 RepID=UPI000B7E4573|nr:MlaD family protein [Candidatus Entotheonella palauensis]
MNTRRTGFRYTNEAVGGIVLISVLVFVAALVQAGRLREWFDPGVKIKVAFPKEGTFGLEEGARVQILGANAGEVRRIVIDPTRRMHAEVYVRDAMRVFIRRDSRALIRKQFGVAGASFLEITRGTGEPIDWGYVVIEATAERAPTDLVTALIEELRSRVVPIVEDLQKTTRALAELTEGLQSPDGPLQRMLLDVSELTAGMARGEGTVGRLMTEDQLTRDLEATALNLVTLTTALNEESDGIPQVMQRVQTMLVSVQDLLTDLRRNGPNVIRLTKNMADTTDRLPALMLQTDQTLDDLDKLIVQLRSLWLLGGKRAPNQRRPSRRLPSLEIKQ